MLDKLDQTKQTTADGHSSHSLVIRFIAVVLFITRRKVGLCLLVVNREEDGDGGAFAFFR